MNISLLSTILALLPLVGAVVAVATYRQSRRRDRVARATESPRLRLTVAYDEANKVDLHCICAPFLGEQLSVPVRIRVCNDGNKSATKLKLMISAPLRFFSKHDIPFTSSGTTGFKAAVAEYLPRTFSYACDIEELHPKQSCDVLFRLLILPATMPEGPLDSSMLVIPIADEDDFLVNAALYQEHAPPILHEFAFRLHDYGLLSINEYFRKYNAILAERWKRQIAGLNGWHRFLIRIKAPSKRVAMIVWPHEQIDRFTDGTPARVSEPSTASVSLGALYPELYWVPSLGLHLP